jgi:hypothetical protein
MAQVGSISVSPNVNVQAIIDSLKEDKKLSFGKESIAEDGSKYIPIERN